MSLAGTLKAAMRGRVEENASLAPFTWFRVGGPADILAVPEDEADLAALMKALPADTPITVIGLASNTLVRDGGVRGVVVRLSPKGFGFAHAEGMRLTVGTALPDVRAARELASQRRVEIELSRRNVLENVTRSWESLLTAVAQITAFKDAVRAAGIALDGVEQEAVVGSRTILDVLDAEQELFDVRVDLVRAERDNVVASYFLQAAIGRLSVSNLGLDVPIYDETLHYKAVRDKFWGFGKVE